MSVFRFVLIEGMGRKLRKIGIQIFVFLCAKCNIIVCAYSDIGKIKFLLYFDSRIQNPLQEIMRVNSRIL